MALFVEGPCHRLEASADKSQLSRARGRRGGGGVFCETVAPCVFPTALQGEASKRRGGNGARLVNTAAAGRLPLSCKPPRRI